MQKCTADSDVDLTCSCHAFLENSMIEHIDAYVSSVSAVLSAIESGCGAQAASGAVQGQPETQTD